MKRDIKFRAWDGDDSISHKDGEYTYVKAEWHPNANKRGYVKRHRLVLERKLGYYLPAKTVVHHLNGNKRDDSEDNLQVIANQIIHAKEHDKGIRNSNGEFVATDPIFSEIKYRLFNKHTQQYEIYTLGKLIKTTFRNSQFKFAGRLTGLHDKNGKEIYEGDILRYESSNDPVNFSCFEVFFHDGDANTDYNIGYSINRIYYHGNICGGVVPSFKPKTTKYMIVIGNIYENPELLDQP